MNSRRMCGDDGHVMSEAVLLMPVALIVLSFLVLCGRMGNVQADATTAARDAARAASQQPNFAAATIEAQRTAAASLAGDHITCRDLSVTVGTPASFHAGGTVTVAVTCTVDLSAVAIPGVPGSSTVTKSSTEVVDRFRAVG